jgi:glycosyltransferase involved in cell wall biosynthesis
MSNRIHIAVNTRLLLPNKLEGIGYFEHETLRRIVTTHPDIIFHFLFDRPYDPQFIYGPNVCPVVLAPPARHPILWYIWFEWAVGSYLREHKIDLFLSPDGLGSLRGNTPSLLVLHDIAYVHYPEYVPRLTRWYYQHYIPSYLAQASRIATVSAYSKQDIARHYSISPNKIDVVYSGVRKWFTPLDATAQQVVRDTYTEGQPYLLYIGAIHPRKNLGRMLEAFDQFKTAHDSPLKFVIVGAHGWQNSSLTLLYNSLAAREDILFMGRQTDEAITAITAAAYALMYVSIFEGFGVPPLEAMQSHVPVITSSVSSMPEICGDAALFADPLDVSHITRQIATLWTDDSLRDTLIARGISQVTKYSWDKSAELLWYSCNQVLDR